MRTFTATELVPGLQNGADTAQRVLEENGIAPDPSLKLVVVMSFSGQFDVVSGDPLMQVTTYVEGSAQEVLADLTTNPKALGV